ncbi:MAG: hypothetical protein H0U88_03290, partial [Chthoniobacterales bacterium]|nr:hypothetical protein [Chthoniobacterales bacterium]
VYRVAPVTPNVGTLSITRGPEGSSIVSGFGVPFQAHTVQATNTLVEPFATIGAATAAADGSLFYEDPGTAGLPQRFYRIQYP